MKWMCILALLISSELTGQDTITPAFLTGRWTVEWGNEYGSIRHDAGPVPVDTLDCKGEWNYEFLAGGNLRFYVNTPDSMETGRWFLQDSLLTLNFGSLQRSFILKKISFTRLESSWRWIDDKTGAQSVTYLHFRRN